MSRSVRVHILTFCRSMEFLYGSELIFRTLRVGFPTARVVVTDNASAPKVVPSIRGKAEACGCEVVTLTGTPIEHHDFIEETIRREAEGEHGDVPLVFLDPDLCLWESCEDFAFDGLVAGKRAPWFFDGVTSALVLPRLHTSFLWIESPRRLWEAILEVKRLRFDFEPFRSCSFCMDGRWYRFDTGASLYAALPDEMRMFDEGHLDRYDHIYSGTHLDWVYDRLDEPLRKLLRQTHRCAREGDLGPLRGIWRYQDLLFRSYKGISAAEGRS